MNNIYDYIENMHKYPDMFTRDHSLGPIETVLHGYCACLRINQIEETGEGHPFTPGDFSAWLHETKGWSTSLGFATALESNCKGSQEAFETFFILVAQFRNSALLENTNGCQ